ncbi:MAG: PfkB family carbohydrate kinase [Schleiferiaceae bacterium]|nr:PfkB family carbohydrate kinase [Schleiferiaceae bacterium]
MSLLIVGTVAFDGLETPFGVREKILGGSALYGSLSAALYTDDVQLVSVVGGDFLASDIQLMADKGINVDGLEVIADQKTFFWKGKYHTDMNSRDTIETQLNVLENFVPKVPESAKSCDIVLLCNLVPAIQMMALKAMNKPSLVVLDTMNLWIDNTLEDLLAILREVDVLTINDEEARLLSGEHNLVKAAEGIKAMGPSVLIIKKGEHGALLFGPEGRIFFAPALPLADVVDPTGAGDCFAGGFVGHLAQTNDFSFDNMKRALMEAATMGSIAVEAFGPERIFEVTREEVRARRALFTDLAQVN